MKRIIKIGMDVHSTNYTLCALECVFGEDDRLLGEVLVSPDYKQIIVFIENLKRKYDLKEGDYDIVCGYEAGCLGISLYNQLTAANIKCVILAPSTMLTQQGKRIKTDARDAELIARCLATGTFHAVHIPTKEDEQVKEFVRMRDDQSLHLKKTKQQILAFCLRHGYRHKGTNWTESHLKFLRSLDLQDTLDRETLDEYLITYDYLKDKLERLDARIAELASTERYQEKVGKLQCFIGIKTHTALTIIVETGDFHRFAKGNVYAAFLGLTPGEQSSGEHVNRTGITKAGNSHLRRLIIEAANGICKGSIGYKSKDLKARQEGNPPEVIAYADKANERLRRKYYKLSHRDKPKNVVKTAVARELACFIWGMMTDNIGNGAVA